MNKKFLNSKEKKRLAEMLKESFGVDYALKEDIIVETGKRKLWICSQDYKKCTELPYRVETIGLYFGQIDKHGELRLGVEGAMLFGKNARKNVVHVNEKERDNWIRGINVEYEGDCEGYVILKYEDNIIGCGKVFRDGILNHVPKERRIRKLI